ncbi:esterase-like activity of phytase family protein [Novosphingobium sp. G106]|nr:esterase-like activity of phytase family protein [Novosphingobium sp. G106]
MWFYQTAAPWNPTASIRFAEVKLPPKAELAHHLGAFELERAWSLTSDYSAFGGYSALLPRPGGRLMAIGDNARRFEFSPPGVPYARPISAEVLPGFERIRKNRDTEAATQDPATGTVWVAREDSNAISRIDPAFRSFVNIRPVLMHDWPRNVGPEAMVRLHDGRFVVIEEGFTGFFEPRLHPAVLFPRDPLRGDRGVEFSFSGSPNFSVTDMAQLPDGRVLVLQRRLLWPFPLHFGGRITIADPAEIRPGVVWHATEVAKLTSSLPVDNFEGMAIEPRADGRVTVWLISDDNHAVTQRTLLWKMVVDPARLP